MTGAICRMKNKKENFVVVPLKNLFLYALEGELTSICFGNGNCIQRTYVQETFGRYKYVSPKSNGLYYFDSAFHAFKYY